MFERTLAQPLLFEQHFQCGLAQQLLNAVEEVFKQPDGTPSLEFLLKLIASLYSGNQDEIDQFVLSEAPTLVDSDTNNALDDVEAVSERAFRLLDLSSYEDICSHAIN